MSIDIDQCDLNHDYFHFSNKENVYSILNSGLVPSIGPASRLVGDKPNVSVSQGGKDIMGIINSYIYMFHTKMKISEIPEEYKKYFSEIENFNVNIPISKEIVYKAIRRKLQDEVYFRVKLNENQLVKAEVGGFTGFDIKLPVAIDPSQLELVTDSNNNVMSAYDVAYYLYEKAKDIDIFRNMHSDFFNMFEDMEQIANIDSYIRK